MCPVAFTHSLLAEMPVVDYASFGIQVDITGLTVDNYFNCFSLHSNPPEWRDNSQDGLKLPKKSVTDTLTDTHTLTDIYTD